MSSWSNDSASTGQHFATDKILIGDVMTTATSLIRADPSDEPWNRVVKLLVLSAVSSIASVANIFVISAVLMEDHLKKRGQNTLLVVTKHEPFAIIMKHDQELYNYT